MADNGIVILDYGSQYTQLIARRIRSKKVYSQILPFSAQRQEVFSSHPRGLILSGGPSSVFRDTAPALPSWFDSVDIPVLGICYGMQLLARDLGAPVESSSVGEYGHTSVKIDNKNDLFSGLGDALRVWMSHGDKVLEAPRGSLTIASSQECKVASFVEPASKKYGVQFHPEVHHTEYGDQILDNFIFNICECSPSWVAGNIIHETVDNIRERVGKGRVICAVSGGVDSSVTAGFVDRAIGKQQVCVFVDNGLLREGENDSVVALLKQQLSAAPVVVDARKRFLARLEGIVNPEEKRKRIGNLFVEIFEEVSKERGPFEFLAQGTLYPDRIESTSTFGPSATIKTHHNVGGLPEKLNFKLIEPLALLFKDEVRVIGAELGLPNEQLSRHPFPGPGLAVRVVGEITEEKLSVLRKADKIFIDALKHWGLYDQVWQAGAVLLPVRSVGVMGDARTYENAVVLRAVTSTDGMTADWAKLDNAFLQEISNRIINSVTGINRVVYDISSKPPSTIEWE
ncbi:MAG: glutamine-hydrolyzing GMP synthase [Candidatus Krumholzibacteria bacterium]|nr:glutamine-hydrolyzing GMP synthase [Candidatus Krumholzibacteria bacterium]